MNIFVFDIETVPDVHNGRKLHGLENLTDKEVAEAMFKLRRQESSTDFLRLHLQRIVAISVILRNQDQLKIWSLGNAQSTESELIKRFFAGIDKYHPTLVSWNGSGFDLPVIHYRSLLHGITATSYWENGENEQSFKWNNYLSRYHNRHTDLMDILAGYQSRANAPLDEIAVMLGLPGKMGMSGAKVWEYFQRDEIDDIRNYCETDVLNTYLVYLRFELIRGNLTREKYQQECALVKSTLQTENKKHFNEFLAAWQDEQH